MLWGVMVEDFRTPSKELPLTQGGRNLSELEHAMAIFLKSHVKFGVASRMWVELLSLGSFDGAGILWQDFWGCRL